MRERLGHDFGRTPFGHHQVVARGRIEEGRVLISSLADFMRRFGPGPSQGDPGDECACPECRS